MRVVEITDSNIDEINDLMTNKNQKVVAKFYADWCGHCQAFKPEWSKFEKWAGENGQKVEAVEGDSNPELCQKYNIEGYPTILKVDSNGEVVDEYQGPRTADGLKQFC